MPLRELFHLMTMVDDFDAADALFQSMFAPDVYMSKSWSDFDKRWASLNRIGTDFVLEVMEASTAEEDQTRPLPKFARRFGQHLHSFAWYVDPADHVPTFRRLQAGGVRVAGPSGLLPDDVADEDVPSVLFTHPRDTCGQIELMEFSPDERRDPLFTPGWDRNQWRDQPLGLVRLGRLTNAVDDLDRATQVFGDLLGGTVFREESDETSARVYVLVGIDTVVELAQPTASDTRLADDLAANGPLPHQAMFQVQDLEAAIDHLEAVGTKVAERTDDTVVVDPSSTFGALFGFTTAVLPNDPRD
jgi:extradiol dioxygenase family protein